MLMTIAPALPRARLHYEGRPCPRCNTTLRYECNDRCVECTRCNRQRIRERERHTPPAQQRKRVRARSRSALELVWMEFEGATAIYTIADRSMTLRQWCAELGQDFVIVDLRIRKSGWTVWSALNTPTNKRAEEP